ncbi:hypothetical protein [Streptomyces sp. NPDC002599]|uniref:hypothetical protein n=1 Tax=Streptomyces sp. NPDC002599 TaxID=3154421 RepID=UPI0033202581
MSTETLALDDLAAPLRALRLLAMDFGHLVAPSVAVSTIYPDRLELTFYSSLTDFEVWRQALGICPDTVIYREQNASRTHWLTASTEFAGTTLELTGYGDIDTPDPSPTVVGGAG